MPDPATSTPGAAFRAAIEAEVPLQIAGAPNAMSALLAAEAGFHALYLSGAGVANACHAQPDLGAVSFLDMAEETRRIAAACPLPMLVDADTGWGNPVAAERGARSLIRAGAAAAHIEDQAHAKRCGHRPGKALCSTGEMAERIGAFRAGRDAEADPAFVIMARTDAYSVEGLDAAIARAQAYLEAGADAIFAEAMGAIEDYERFCAEVKAPVLANITEFGKTPLFSVDELRGAGAAMALYPLSAFRAMNRAAATTYSAIRADGHQRGVLKDMQTRDELYATLDYRAYEDRMDRYLSD